MTKHDVFLREEGGRMCLECSCGWVLNDLPKEYGPRPIPGFSPVRDHLRAVKKLEKGREGRL